MKQLLNECIKTWPYRKGANSIPSYASALGFDIFDVDNELDILFNYELFLNLLHWAPTYDMNRADLFSFSESSTVNGECVRCIENIEYKLEMVNMQVRKIDNEEIPQYVISKRNAQVDAVIESVPELSDILLSYLDVRNQKDEGAKKAILKAIADYLEDRHKSNYYKCTMYSSLGNNIFAVFNKFGIRHGDKNQIKLSKSERVKLYDQTFKAVIHLLQMEDIKIFNDTVSKLKEKNC